ncbi:MAG: site-specific DNA-methyltransferase [Ignavibacteriales bacterium]|nr:site-specific DNA-methyltransferase [Ignavibacteriales bacterium]
MVNEQKYRAPRNKTITLSKKEIDYYSEKTISLNVKASVNDIKNKTINQNIFETIKFLPDNFVDLMVIDPPYNLNKKFNSTDFKRQDELEYLGFVDSWLSQLIRILKSTASIYVCCDWQSSPVIYSAMSKYFIIRNRITWEREKGRGAKSNWKNCSEDIWFGTLSNDYYFNVDAVKMKRKVIAPYTSNGKPKDWERTENGNFRITHPSNFWNDISIPYWSMPENTDHPTQKPEKLIAKLILASCSKDGFVFDPFLGSGTTSVVAKKLGMNYCGIEIDKIFACLCEKRLELAETDKKIQGYTDGVFWERNTLNIQSKLIDKTERTK